MMGKFKQLLVWRCEFETLEQARKEIATFIDNYHHRRHTELAPSCLTPGFMRRWPRRWVLHGRRLRTRWG